VAESPTGPTSFLRRQLQSAGLTKRRQRTPSLVTAIDIDGQTLRVAQSIPRGQVGDITFVSSTSLEFAVDADRTDPLVMGAAVAKALAKLKIKPNGVVMGVPRAQVVLRTLTLPAVPDLREMASIVHLQLARDLPFRIEEAVLDFKVGRRNTPAPRADSLLNGGVSVPDAKAEGAAQERIEVLVAALKQDVVGYYQQVADTAGLRLIALGLLPYANARCVEACHVADGQQAFALVSLRPDEVNIDVIADQSLLFSRGALIKAAVEPVTDPAAPASSKSEVISEAESAAAGAGADSVKQAGFTDAVTIEVVRTLHSYSGIETLNPVTKIVVAGATGFEPAVVELLSKRLNRPAALLDPATALSLPAEACQQASGAIAAIGLTLGLGDSRGLPFDFLNPKRPAVQRDMGRIRILAGTAAVAAILVFTAAVRSYLINQRTQTNRNVAMELAEAEKHRPIYRKMIQQAAAIEDWAKGAPNWLDHYAYLSAVLPPSDEVYITSLAVSAQGVLRLSVQAQSGEILAKLDKQLRAAGYDVKPIAITPGADRYGYEFRSNVELIVPEKLKIDLTKVKAPKRPADDGSLDPKLHRGGTKG
jgi:Tfp pilus assembly PilM family ATPase